MTTGATPQERLAWLKTNQPNNLEAIAALERRLGVHGGKKELRTLPLRRKEASFGEPAPLEDDRSQKQCSELLDTDFYTRLKALHAKTGQTVYQCCKQLGLATDSISRMDEAERMVCRFTREGKIVWRGSLPIFQ